MLQTVKKNSPLTISIILTTFVLFIISMWYALSPFTTKAETISNQPPSLLETTPEKQYGDSYVIIHLDTNTITLHHGRTVETFDIISQGKPGSYYETIGGVYVSDYKEPLHFSSIGHVYMPYSIHIFGNYFIHGIPYYPNGTKVSSTYSGGCIRLGDSDMERIYNFITPSTPIIITRLSKDDFSPTATTTISMNSFLMTNLMVATISLELLTQDNKILDTNDTTMTTRRSLLPRLLNNHDTSVSILYAKSLGEKAFIQAMNNKAESLGLTNTKFINVTSPAFTTEEDYARFMNYITTYKSYLWTDFSH